MHLIKENLIQPQQVLTEFEAFLLLVMNVKYADRSERIGTEIRTCHRGESFKSLQEWSELFHWSASKTRRYFVRLKDQGFIEWEGLTRTTRIKITSYDYYVGHHDMQNRIKYTPEFEDFWRQYHETTYMQAVDKDAAYRIWRKFSLDERKLAISNINNYYYGLSKTTYCVKALTYLKNKKFNDEFYY